MIKLFLLKKLSINNFSKYYKFSYLEVFQYKVLLFFIKFVAVDPFNFFFCKKFIISKITKIKIFNYKLK